MIYCPKKRAFGLCVLLTYQTSFGMAAYIDQAWHQATATKGRTIATILAASYLGYEAYRFASLALKRSLLEQKHALNALASHGLPPAVDADKPCATLFAHGLSATSEQADEYDRLLKINHTVHTFNFADAGKEISNMRQCGLAQEHDSNQLKSQIDAHADKNLMLFGLSRGASTVITAMGIHRPKNVRGLILESPFDDMRSVVAHQASYAAWIPGVTALGNLATSFIFPNYSSCALRPIDCVTYIPDDIPVLFVCSEQDRLVPASGTQRLYGKLKQHRAQRGAHNVYLMQTETGLHAKIVHNHQEQYQQVVHAFYKKAGLSESAYNGELAKLGERFLV